jgi:hypothetical protein
VKGHGETLHWFPGSVLRFPLIIKVGAIDVLLTATSQDSEATTAV